MSNNEYNNMTLNNIWTDNNKLRLTFSWLTRIGAAPKFGTLPIAYYQHDQCAAIDKLEAALKAHGLTNAAELRCKGGLIQARGTERWVTVAMLVCGQIVVR